VLQLGKGRLLFVIVETLRRVELLPVEAIFSPNVN
jgi:hypothetical protein